MGCTGFRAYSRVGGSNTVGIGVRCLRLTEFTACPGFLPNIGVEMTTNNIPLWSLNPILILQALTLHCRGFDLGRLKQKQGLGGWRRARHSNPTALEKLEA